MSSLELDLSIWGTPINMKRCVNHFILSLKMRIWEKATVSTNKSTLIRSLTQLLEDLVFLRLILFPILFFC